MTAAEKILRKALVASNLDSREWNGIQAGLRDRAFFSSRVAQANILDALRQRTAEYADGHTSMSDIRQRMRKDLETLRYTPEKGAEGTIRDLYSKARLDVIVKQNVATARGFIRWAEGNSPGAYAAFPAQEFKRVHPRKNARGDWPQRWAKAGGKIYGGRMIALKDDPVWTKLSVFGNPYPPFDWGSGMGVRDIDRKTAIALGLIDDAGIRDKVQKLEERRERGDLPSMNGNLQATFPTLRKDSLCGQILDRAFGDQIKIENSVVKFESDIIRKVLHGEVPKVSFGEASEKFLDLASQNLPAETANAFKWRRLGMSHQFFLEHGGKHLDPNEPYDHLTPMEFELLPELWRNPSRIVTTRDPNRAQVELDTFDGGCILAIIDCRNGLKSIQKRIPRGIT